jgi:dolichyl-diphosphooligosaccharide--protein glycosyltransferase/undecaprenyl-diphosphooligosaccharide--protein glycosyltransferase
VVLIYTLIFERRERYNYKLLLFMLVTVTPMPLWIRIVLLLGLYGWFHFDRERSDKFVLPLLGGAALLFVLFGGFGPVWYQIKGYLLRESAEGTTADLLNLHFYAVSKTVREAGQIPFELFADRISGSPITFVLSVIGYLALAWRYRVMWLALPMLGLGFLAMQGGLRFTVYAVPVCALGMGYLVVWFAGRLAGYAATEKAQRMMSYAAVAAATLLILWPNIRHVEGYKVPTVFTKNEVKVLDRLHSIAGREDYVLSWWDYGYPIRYYSDVKTLVDGGKHSGDVNYPVSFALTRPQVASANMARLDVEYTERDLRQKRSGSYLAQMMEDANVTQPETFLAMLQNPQMPLPKKSREIYYYLPLRMLNIFPTVAIFSAIDPGTGRVSAEPSFYQFRRYEMRNGMLYLGGGLVFDPRQGVLHSGKRAFKINRFVETVVTKEGKTVSKTQTIDPASRWYLVYMKSYGRFLLMDKRMFDSTYVQLFVLGHYDPELFEPVILTPMAKVYRLKK